MSPDPDRRYLGRKMQDHWAWARDSIPLLTFRSTDEVARVVRVARDEIKGLTYIIEFVTPFASMFVTWRLVTETGADTGNFRLVATLLAGFVCTIAAQFACLLLFRRKFASIARGTYPALPYA